MSRKPASLLIELPYFPGFYDSSLSDAIDREEEMWIEYHAEPQGEHDPDYEEYWPKPLRLSSGDYAEILFDVTKYSAAHKRIASWYPDVINNLMKDAFGFDAKLTFESMESPREYNFGTDRVFARIPFRTANKLFALSKANKHAKLEETIQADCTSYDGFHSFYSNDLDAWLRKPLKEWDHNELNILLKACFAIENATPDYWDDITESLVGNEGAYEAWSNAVDWDAFERKRQEKRDELLAEIREYNPGAYPEYGETIIAYRCPLTVDMFAGRIG